MSYTQLRHTSGTSGRYNLRTPSSSLESIELKWTENNEMEGMATGQMYSSPIRASNQRTLINPNREAIKCKAFVEGGWCPFGETCEFIHPTNFNLPNNFQNQNNLAPNNHNNFKPDTVSITMDNGGNYSPETVNTQFQMDTMSSFSSQHPQQMTDMMMALSSIKKMNSSEQQPRGGQQQQEVHQGGEQVFDLPMFSPPAGNLFSESVNSWNNKVLKLKSIN